MRVGAVSGDLVIKLAMGAAVVVAGLYLVKRARQAIPDLAGYVNPLNPENVANQAVNEAVTAVVGYPETLGGAVYDLFHRNPVTVNHPVIDYSTDNPMVTPSGMDFGQVSG